MKKNKNVSASKEAFQKDEEELMKINKNTRILNLYTRLCEGKQINKEEEVNRFRVNERSIQRDIDDMRAFLSECSVSDENDNRKIEYDRKTKCYVMTGIKSSSMTNSELLAVSKILLASRAFTRQEMNEIMDKLVEGCVPQKNKKLVSDLISNEKYHYVELPSNSFIQQDKLWKLGEEIRECNLLEIVYEKQAWTRETITRIVQPVAVLFSDYYFYLNAFIIEKEENGKYIHKYQYPAIFRIDRIISYHEMKEKLPVVYTDRFEEGEFRKRTQFMYAGSLIKLQFRYTGASKEYILDRLPTARVISEDEKGCIIEAEVYGQGILMWLKMQGERVEILKPEKYRNRMREDLIRMLKCYEEENI